MNQLIDPNRKCPKCDSPEYQFRGRRTIDAPLEQGGGQFIETKYQCKACSKSWKEKVAVGEKKEAA